MNALRLYIPLVCALILLPLERYEDLPIYTQTQEKVWKGILY